MGSSSFRYSKSHAFKHQKFKFGKTNLWKEETTAHELQMYAEGEYSHAVVVRGIHASL